MVVTWRVGQVRSGAYSHEPGREPRLWGSTGTNGVGDEVPTPVAGEVDAERQQSDGDEVDGDGGECEHENS